MTILFGKRIILLNEESPVIAATFSIIFGTGDSTIGGITGSGNVHQSITQSNSITATNTCDHGSRVNQTLQAILLTYQQQQQQREKQKLIESREAN